MGYKDNVKLKLKREEPWCNFIGKLMYTQGVFRCSLPKAMSISRSEIFRKKKKAAEETENSNLLSVKVLESVCLGHLLQ